MHNLPCPHLPPQFLGWNDAVRSASGLAEGLGKRFSVVTGVGRAPGPPGSSGGLIQVASELV